MITSAMPAAITILNACLISCFRVVFITAMFDAPRGSAPTTEAVIPINK